MRSKIAKRIRGLIDPDQSEFSRKLYRKLKKYYAHKVPRKHRQEFLDAVEGKNLSDLRNIVKEEKLGEINE